MNKIEESKNYLLSLKEEINKLEINLSIKIGDITEKYDILIKTKELEYMKCCVEIKKLIKQENYCNKVMDSMNNTSMLQMNNIVLVLCNSCYKMLEKWGSCDKCNKMFCYECSDNKLILYDCGDNGDYCKLCYETHYK